MSANPSDDEATPTSLPDVGEPGPFAGPVLRRTGEKPRRTIAVSGAKGGAGKSIAACNLAIYLSTLGRTTLLVDADRSGAHLHTLLGVAPQLPAQRLTRDAEPQAIVATQVPGLYFLHGGVDEGHGPGATREALAKQLAEVDCDYLVLDLGAGIESDLLDVYLEADLALYVTLPEPPAVEGTYRFVRALYLRGLFRAAWPEQRAGLMALARELGGLPVPRELVEALESDRHPLAERARALLEEQELHFVVNQSRVRTDLELGESMRSAAWQRLGFGLHYLGYIDHDDNVWACVRERKPLLIKSPGTKASKSFEKLSRRLLSLDAQNRRAEKRVARGLRTAPRGSHHDLLEIDRGATDEEIRRAYRRMREVYAEEALCCYGLYTPDELRAVRTQLDEGFDVLLDPARRRPYELSVFPDAESQLLEEAPLEARPRELPPAPAISPETEFDGALLRLVRESQGLELKHISRRTKINLSYLEAVEGDDFSALPALVYVRGFVAEMAKCLRLDPVQVAHTYVRRVKQQVGESV